MTFFTGVYFGYKKGRTPKSAILKGISDKNGVDFYGHFDRKKMSKNASTKSLTILRDPRLEDESRVVTTSSSYIKKIMIIAIAIKNINIIPTSTGPTRNSATKSTFFTGVSLTIKKVGPQKYRSF